MRAPAQLQRLGRVTPQRWLLAVVAIASIVGASIVAGISGGGLPPLVLVIVGALAVLSAIRPDAHTALVAIGVVVWQWLVVVDDTTGLATVAVALGVLVFHATIALMSSAPVTATLGTDILQRWLGRVGLVAAGTVATWGLVVLMDRREAPGSAALTFAGFVVALVLVAALRGFTQAGGGQCDKSQGRTGRCFVP